MGIRSDFYSPNCYGGGLAAEQKLTFCYSLTNKQAACQEVNCLRLTGALLSGKKECPPKFANASRLGNCRRFTQNLVASSSQNETRAEVRWIPGKQERCHAASADPNNGFD
jgi:hypothetical protein